MSTAQLKEVNFGVYKWSELPVKQGTQRVGRKIMEGSSPHFKYLEIHATTQEKGAKPAAPHTQQNVEEIIIVKEGLMKMTMDGKSEILSTGSVIHIPPLVEQSMENVGDGPLTYYVMMYTAKKPMDVDRGNKAGGLMSLNSEDLEFETTSKGGKIRYFDRSTAMCEKFEMHVTQLNQKGPSHNPHSHMDSEIVLIIEGQTELLIGDNKYQGSAGDLFFINSNQLHGVSNNADAKCRYFAFRWN
ncbi:MAG: cupin domain-containing protein [Cyclobacteriaceae bacterium]|nr:cupin domain-containing protein [Cyclobacteriaceae bacterium]